MKINIKELNDLLNDNRIEKLNYCNNQIQIHLYTDLNWSFEIQHIEFYVYYTEKQYILLSVRLYENNEYDCNIQFSTNEFKFPMKKILIAYKLLETFLITPKKCISNEKKLQKRINEIQI